MRVLWIVAGLGCVCTLAACSIVLTAGPPSPADLNAWQILSRVDQSDTYYGSTHAVGWLKTTAGGPGRRVRSSVRIIFTDDTTLVTPLRWRIRERVIYSHRGAASRVEIKNFRVGARLAEKVRSWPGWECLRLTSPAAVGLHGRQADVRPARITQVAKAWIVPTKRRSPILRVEAVLKRTSSTGSGRTVVEYTIAKSNFVVTHMNQETRAWRSGHWTTVKTYMRFSKYGEGVPAWLPMCH